LLGYRVRTLEPIKGILVLLSICLGVGHGFSRFFESHLFEGFCGLTLGLRVLRAQSIVWGVFPVPVFTVLIYFLFSV